MDDSEDIGPSNVKSQRTVKRLTIRTCKYCSLRFSSATYKKLYQRHIKSHEKKYFKHWFKMLVDKETGEKPDEPKNIGNSKFHLEVTDNRKSGIDGNIPDIVENYCTTNNQEGSSNTGSKSNESNNKNYFFRSEKPNEIKHSEGFEYHSSEENTNTILGKKQVYVYVVFAPEGTCSCEPSDLSSVPCNCNLEYKKFIFDSIEHFHDASLDHVSYKCPICHKKVLANKLKEKRSKLKCQKCDDNFENADKFTDHQQTCYGFVFNFQCLQCSFETSSKDKMVKHSTTHSTKVRYTQREMTNQDPRKRLLAYTRKQVNNYACPICGNRFKDGSQLRKHVLSHQQKKAENKSVVINHSMRMKKIAMHNEEEEDDNIDDDDDDYGSNYSDEDSVIKQLPKQTLGMRVMPRRQSRKMYTVDDLENEGMDLYKEKRKDPFKDLQFKCNFCERAFNQATLLQTHKHAMHSGKSPYVCLVCLKRFNRQNDFIKHGRYHKDATFKCTLCTGAFRKMELLHNHEYIHEKDKPVTMKTDKSFSCTVCNATFPTARILSKHVKTHSLWDDLQEESEDDVAIEPLRKIVKLNSHVCQICKALFKSADELKLHCKTHDKEEYKCKQCGLLCLSHLDLFNHAERHKHKCQFCKLTFGTLAACKIHEKTHASEKESVFKCSFCAKQFQFKNDHQIHENLHKEYDGKRPEPKKYKCKYCGKGLSYQRDLKIHEELHESRTRENANKYNCKFCDKIFDDKEEYQRHRRNHVRDKLPEPTKCQDCDKVFKYGSLLKEHNKTHWAEKPFICIYCKARFKTKHEHDDHEVIHLSGKRHPCRVCNRLFRTKKNMSVHMRQHTGEKPYVCSFCPKRFAHTTLRHRHERIHTGECPYVCEICDRAFAYDSSLKVHYESHRKKGIQVPEKCGMARGIRRQNAAYRKPPSSITKRKDSLSNPDQQKMLSKEAAASTAGPSSGASASVRRQSTTQKRHTPSSPPTQVPLTISKSTQRHASNIAQNNNPHNPNAPIQVTIQPSQIPVQVNIQQGKPMDSTAQDPPVSVVQGLLQRREDLQETSWEALHSRYIQPTQNWQTSHNWQQLGQQLSGGSNWDIQSGNWSGPVPPSAHQGHSGVPNTSVITSALYGILPRDIDVHKVYQVEENNEELP